MVPREKPRADQGEGGDSGGGWAGSQLASARAEKAWSSNPPKRFCQNLAEGKNVTPTSRYAKKSTFTFTKSSSPTTNRRKVKSRSTFSAVKDTDTTLSAAVLGSSNATLSKYLTRPIDYVVKVSTSVVLSSSVFSDKNPIDTKMRIQAKNTHQRLICVMLNEVLLEKYFANGRKDTVDEMIVFIKCRSTH